MVHSILRPVNDRRTTSSNSSTSVQAPSSRSDYGGQSDPYSRSDYRHDDRPTVYVSEPRSQQVTHRTARRQPPSISSHEALRRLGGAVGQALHIFAKMQSDFRSETSQLYYVEDVLMDYIWEDKMTYGESKANQEHTDDDESPQTLAKRLSSHLSDATDALAYETPKAIGDNSTLFEKLNRMSKDIETSRGSAFKRQKPMDALLTDLEMLYVLLKRHGGVVGIGEHANPRMRQMPTRTSSYERPRVDEEHDDHDDGHMSDGGATTTTDGGFHDIGRATPESPVKIIQLPTPGDKAKKENAAKGWGAQATLEEKANAEWQSMKSLQ